MMRRRVSTSKKRTARPARKATRGSVKRAVPGLPAGRALPSSRPCAEPARRSKGGREEEGGAEASPGECRAQGDVEKVGRGPSTLRKKTSRKSKATARGARTPSWLADEAQLPLAAFVELRRRRRVACAHDARRARVHGDRHDRAPVRAEGGGLRPGTSVASLPQETIRTERKVP